MCANGDNDTISTTTISTSLEIMVVSIDEDDDDWRHTNKHSYTGKTILYRWKDFKPIDSDFKLKADTIIR